MKQSSVRLYVCLSVCAIIRRQQRHAVGLLLSAVTAGDIDRKRRNCSSVQLSGCEPCFTRGVYSGFLCMQLAGSCSLNHVNAIDDARACFETKDGLQYGVHAPPCTLCSKKKESYP